MPAPFAKYVSAVSGRLVPRYGLRGAYIGATLDPTTGRATFDTEAVSALTADEWQRFGREYRRALAAGDLTERTETDFLDQ